MATHPTKAKRPKEFKPNKNQLAALAFFQDRGYRIKSESGRPKDADKGKRATVTGMAKCIGIDRSLYYRWFDIPGFAAWWVNEAEKFFVRHLAAVQGTLLEAATTRYGATAARVSTRAMRIYLERFDKGFVPQTKHAISGDVSININISEIDGPDTGPGRADEQSADKPEH